MQPVEEKRLLRHLGDDHGLAGLHDAAEDALAQPVLHRLALAVRKLVRHLDTQLAPVGPQEGDRSARQAQAAGQHVQHLGQHLPLPRSAGENLADAEQALAIPDRDAARMGSLPELHRRESYFHSSISPDKNVTFCEKFTIMLIARSK